MPLKEEVTLSRENKKQKQNLKKKKSYFPT